MAWRATMGAALAAAGRRVKAGAASATLAAALAASLPTAAAAQSRTLATQGGEGNVLVWRDGKSMDEGLGLIRAGVHRSNPQLLVRLLSCAVPSGTKGIVTDAGFMTHSVLVTEGRAAGCRGDVPVEFVR